ncbi:MAG TPA: ABC transporter substrate-binding protein [Ardenticatenaceae bacterium]|nr:ABC transporter substrate-binding protein [Ardenticatenaceae bacterium]
MTQYLRWQALIALSGILLFFTVLVYLSQNLTVRFVPERGGTYIEGLVGQPANLNPLYLQSQSDHDIAALVFNGLTRASVNGEIEPELARRWEIGADNQSYTFRLRDDVFWHDGEPFSAADVLYTIGVLQDPAYTGDPTLAEVWRTARARALDPLTVRVTLPEPYAPFLSFTTFGILPSHLLEGYDVATLPTLSFSRSPVGTGQWRVAEATADSVALEANAQFFGPAPQLDRVRLRFYPDAREMLQGYGRSEVMGLGQVPPDDLIRVAEEPGLTLWNAPLNGFTGIVLNLTHPILSERGVRQGLLSALDRPALIAQALNGQGIVANSFIVPTNWAYNPGLRTYAFDPAEADRLLTYAGWIDYNGDGVREKDGAPLTFQLATNEENPQRVRLAQAVAAQWRDIGADVEVVPVPFQVLRQEMLGARNFEAAMFMLADLPADPDPYPLFHSSQRQAEGRNFSGFASERADRLMVEGRFVTDQTARRELYFDLQEIFAEQLPILPLYHPIYNYAVDTRVRNVQIGPLNQPSDRFRTLPDWFIKTRRVIEGPAPITARP